MFFSKRLSKCKNISHGFFNRSGGKSSGIYKSLNCGIGSNDKRYKIKQNLKIVKNKINRKAKEIFFVRQVHSNKFVFIDKHFKIKKKRVSADAIVTNQKMLPIAILTADCVPLLIHDKKRDLIAAIHAGWKGAFKGIIKKVIKFMLKKGCKKNDIIVAIGPCIKQKNYNVGYDFQKKFIKKNKKNKIFFKNKKNTIYYDLSNFVKSQLRSIKITNIDTINIDTFDKKNNFFSARRSLRLKHDDYGRYISIIMVN